MSCNCLGFDNICGEVVVIKWFLAGVVTNECTEVGTIIGDKTVGVISVWTKGVVPTDVAATGDVNTDGATKGGANIVDVTKGEIKEDEALIGGGFDNAVYFIAVYSTTPNHPQFSGLELRLQFQFDFVWEPNFVFEHQIEL